MVRYVFSPSLLSKRRKTTTQHEEFVRDDVREGFYNFSGGAGRRKKDWARQLQLQLSLLLLLFLLLLF
jgi:hypothetical protein